MSENKFTTYFLYAIGEIILVVIGILIAIQIDHWNENRKQRKIERDYLSEIRTNLQEDTAQINTVIRFDSVKLESIRKTFLAFGSEKSEFQIIVEMGNYFDHLFSFSELTQSRVAFDNMVSSESINLISDRELRTELSNYYSRSFSSEERVREVTRKTRDLLAPHMFTEETVGIFSPNLKVKIPDDEIKFYQNRNVFSTINGNKVLTEQQIFQAFEMNVEAVELMELIDEFLEKEN